MWLRFSIIVLYIILGCDYPCEQAADDNTIVQTHEMKKGATVELTATPLDGFVFSYWSSEGLILSDSLTYRFTMPDHNFSITANFLREK